MAKYETTIVFDSFLKDEDKDNLLTKAQNFIKNNGGEIELVEEWGKRRLAYEIARKQYGIYVYLIYSGPGTLPGLLEREFRLEESILRHLTIKFDARMEKWRQEKEAEAAAEAAPPPTDESSSETGDSAEKTTATDEKPDAEAAKKTAEVD